MASPPWGGEAARPACTAHGFPSGGSWLRSEAEQTDEGKDTCF